MRRGGTIRLRPLFDKWIADTRLGLNRIEGGSASHAYVPERAVTTLNGTNISRIADLWSTADLIQGTIDSQPAHISAGGPLDLPYINLQDTARLLTATFSIGSGNRAALYVVGKFGPNAGATRTLARLASGNAVRLSSSDTYRWGGTFTGGTQLLNTTVPAKDQLWHVFSILPLATGALTQVGGVTTTATFSGNDTCAAVTGVTVGETALSYGDVAGLFVVDNITAAKDAYMQSSLAVWFGDLP
jgi:hypothetical protein